MRILEPIRRHPVASYILLSLGLSWAYWIPMAIRGETVTAGGSFSHFPGLFGPLLAAAVLTAILGGGTGLRDFMSRLARWRIPVRWYLVGAVPLVIMLVAIAITAITGGQTPTFADFAKYSGVPVVALPLVVLLVLAGAFGEEAGWRGFLTPKLLATHGALTASLVVAVVWFTWHGPLFWVVDSYRQMGFAIVPMLGIGLMAGAIVLTWLYVASGGSILVVALWHTALNMGSATSAGSGLAGMLIWIGTVVWAIAVVVGWRRASANTRQSMPCGWEVGLQQPGR